MSDAQNVPSLGIQQLDGSIRSRKGMWLKSFAYVAPQIGLALLIAPIVAVLGGMYTKYYGLSLVAIGIKKVETKKVDRQKKWTGT